MSLGWSDSEQSILTAREMKRIRIFIIVVSLLASSLIVVYKLKVSAHWLALDTMIHKALDAPDVVGCSLALSTSDGQLWSRATGYEHLLSARSRLSAELITLSQKHSPAVMREETWRGNSLILLCLEHRHAIAVASNVSDATSVDILQLALTALERSEG